MNQNSNATAQGGGASPRTESQTDYSRFTKAQLIRRLRYAEFMMFHMRDSYREYAAKPEVFPFSHDRERGYASAMEDALGFIKEGPSWPDDLDEIA